MEPTELLKRYVNFFLDFERTVTDDEWCRITGYFREDAVYYVSGLTQAELHGVHDILSGIRKSLNGFDRVFDGRTHEPEGMPVEEGNTVRASGKILYNKQGLPPLVLRGKESVEYDADGRIKVLRNEFPVDQPEVLAWIERHGIPLDPSYV